MIEKWSNAGMIAALTALLAMAGPAQLRAEDLKVISDVTVMDFKFPESVAYDPDGQALYVSEFGSELKPTQKDGAGQISKVGLDGKVVEEAFLPGNGQTLDKPKGVWIANGRLWATDIDSVWVFDIATKKGKKLPLPGAQFANDATIVGDVLYVSDNRGDQLFRIEPADFLAAEPKVELVFSGQSINPNGVYPAADGSLLMVGFASADDPRGIYSMAPGGEPEELAADLGRLDGLYELENGDLLVTNWDTGSLSLWNAKTGIRVLADGFDGPADFAVIPNDQGLLVAAPDLVKGELRLIQLGE